MLKVSLKVPPLQCIDDIDCVNGVIALKPIFSSSHFRTLSWVRVRDGHILTVDHETFISDPRFSSLPLQQNNIWTLQVGTVLNKNLKHNLEHLHNMHLLEYLNASNTKILDTKTLLEML